MRCRKLNQPFLSYLRRQCKARCKYSIAYSAFATGESKSWEVPFSALTPLVTQRLPQTDRWVGGGECGSLHAYAFSSENGVQSSSFFVPLPSLQIWANTNFGMHDDVIHISFSRLRLKLKKINGKQSNLINEHQRAEFRQDFYHQQTEQEEYRLAKQTFQNWSSQRLEFIAGSSFAPNWAQSVIGQGNMREEAGQRLKSKWSAHSNFAFLRWIGQIDPWGWSLDGWSTQKE